MTITYDEAIVLHRSQTLYSTLFHTKRASFRTIRVNGKVKTWKRDPLRRKNFEIPVKRGMKECWKLHVIGDGIRDARVDNTGDWWVSEEKAHAARIDAVLARGGSS